MKKNIVFAAVVVTFNRINKLKIALHSFSNQLHKPDYLIVVNNASTDGTNEYLAKWEAVNEDFKKIVISNDKNLGGSYGFYQGLELATKMDVDWIWVSDDDAYPYNDVFEKANNFLNKCRTEWNSISAICGAVINGENVDLGHRKRFRQRGLIVESEMVPIEEYKNKEFPLNGFSYVGTFINKKKILEVGLPKKEYFIWYDDSEHSIRLGKCGRILCLPEMKIQHDVNNTSEVALWKYYYGVRNCADMYRNNFSNGCYLYYCCKILVRQMIKNIIGKNKEVNKMMICAIRDCHKGKFGIHSMYKPGWLPKDKV